MSDTKLKLGGLVIQFASVSVCSKNKTQDSAEIPTIAGTESMPYIHICVTSFVCNFFHLLPYFTNTKKRDSIKLKGNLNWDYKDMYI